MTTENKKYLVYGGVAFLVGSLGYFIYTTLKNKNSSVAENETVIFSEKESASDTNPFRDMLNNPSIPSKIDYEFKTPPIVPKGFFDISKNIFMN
jgi:hypothetical protein